jgi:hypothetical protein
MTKQTRQDIVEVNLDDILTISTKAGVLLWTHTGRRRNTDGRTDARTGTSLNSRVGAEHTNSRAKLGSTERYHMLADVTGNKFTMLRIGVSQDVLNEVVAILITGDVDQWDAGAIDTSLADTIKIAAEEVWTTNLEALLNDLGGKLIHAVLGGVTNNMVNGTAAISWGTMLANVLNAPVAKLTMSNDVNASKDLLDAWTLEVCQQNSSFTVFRNHTLSTSRQFSKMF